MHAPHRQITVVAALLVGVLVAVQSRINAELTDYVGNGVVAAAISFGTGLVLVVAIILSRSQYRASLPKIPAALRDGRLHWWQLLGGLGGAWLVTTQGLVVTVVGVMTFTIAVVAGQVTGSLLVDRAGLSPAGRMAVTPNRAIAAGIAFVAVALAGMHGSSFSLSWVVVLAVSAGLAIAVQQACRQEKRMWSECRYSPAQPLSRRVSASEVITEIMPNTNSKLLMLLRPPAMR